MGVTQTEAVEAVSPKRAQMLAAARALFMAQGYGAVSMDAVARAAGVSKATLYAHFSSKDQLFATIIGDACRSNIEGSIGAEGFLPMAGIAGPDDLRTALIRFGQRMIRFFLEPDTLAIHRIVIAESARFPELGQAFYDNGPVRVRASLALWLAEQARSGWLDVSDPATAAEHFVALVRGNLYLRASLNLPRDLERPNPEETVVAVVDMFLRAYGTPPPTGPYLPRGS